jgi:hypothetical protein
MISNNATVAIYRSHAEAETAIKELQHAGFDLEKIPIVGLDYYTEEHVTGYYNSDDRMKNWGKNGAFWGEIWGLSISGTTVEVFAQHHAALASPDKRSALAKCECAGLAA